MKWSLATCKLFPSHAHSCDQAFIHKVLWQFRISAFLWWSVSTLPIPGIRNLHQKVFFTFRNFGTLVIKSLDSWLLQLPVFETPKWSQINSPQSWWFDGPDLFVISHIASSCRELLPWLLQLLVSETTKWSQINDPQSWWFSDPDHSLINDSD